MKDIGEIHCAVIDSGTFIPLAEMMAKSCARVSYYSPHEQEYLGIERCIIGDGMPTFDRVDDYMEPEFFNTVDLWVFPDINFGGFQRYLRALGKPVWGHMGADELELYRTRFLKVLQEVELPTVNSKVIRGLTALSEHLKGVENKWVKINRFRANMETWHHRDWLHSQREIERESCEFGPLKDKVIYVVQDAIDGTDESPVLEVGYDGWSIDGWFPDKSFQGYELKNKLYLGSLRNYDDLPEAIRYVNEQMSPVLKRYGYRNFYANEIRIKDDVAYHIDPTNRMAGQTMEHLTETCENLPEIIWKGAHAEEVQPKFTHTHAAEATLHYHTESGGEGWKTFNLPEDAAKWVKLYRCCFADGAYHFPPDNLDELGIIMGLGNSVGESIDNLKENFARLKDEPVSIDLSGFGELLYQIEEAEEEGVAFSEKPLPESAEEVLDLTQS
jgi:hypothetical protein